MVRVVKADEASLLQVAHNMRHEDAREVETVTGVCPYQAAHNTLTISLSLPGVAYVAYLGEVGTSSRPFAAFGCSMGVVWLLCTDEVYKAKLSTFREAKKYIKQWLVEYSVLHNWADTRNTLHLDWIRALGFTFGRTMEINGVMFQEFYMEYEHRKVHNV